MISSELKDCQRIIGAVTNESIAEAKPDTNYGVSILLADIDTVAVKLAEFINKRAKDVKSNHCPVIPTIFFTHDGVDESDLLDSLTAVGGATKILKASCPTKDVLYTIIEVLYKCKLVDDTYKELNEKKTLISKYPYYPLFQSTKEKSSTSSSQQHLNRKFRDASGHDADDVSIGNASEISFLKLSERLEDRDDWTAASSMLPNFVKDIRKNSPPRQRSSPKSSEVAFSADKAAPNKPIEIANGTEQAPVEALDLKNSFSSSRDSFSFIESDAVVMDPLNYQFPMNSQDGDIEKVPNSFEKSIQLLHPSSRPTCSLLNPRKNANILATSTDIYPFFNKPMPELNAQLTVGGLDKKFVAPCWDILHSQLFLKDKEKDKDKNKSNLFDQQQLSSTLNRIKNSQDERTSTPELPSQVGVLRKSFGRKVSFSEGQINSGRDHSDDDNASRSSMNSVESFSFRPSDRSPPKRQGTLPMAPTSRGTNLGVLLDIQASKAEKKIMALTNEVAPDILFTKLIEIDFNNRKINTGELDILQKGMKLEREGDLHAATTCYKRAGIAGIKYSFFFHKFEYFATFKFIVK